LRERLVDFEVSARGGVLVATVGGEIDSSNATELRLALTEHLPSSMPAMILDLSQVRYIDSAGVELLFELGRRLATRRQALRIVIPRGAPPRRVLELCSVGDIAPLDGDLDRSLAEITQ
jgi:anti-sigma B factor antagonist